MVAHDPWAEWLLHRRDGGDAGVKRAIGAELAAVRDRVLGRLDLSPGASLLDVGTGDGLIAFAALDQVGPGGRVIFSDVSETLLDVCRHRAGELGVSSWCEFVRAAADDLAAIADDRMDAVTTRAVLIYVANKQRALEEFHRVLKPGGMISIHEPINALMFPEPPDEMFGGYDAGPVADLAAKLRQRELEAASRDCASMTDFDDRDLFTFTERAGFIDVHLELRREAAWVEEPRSWQAFLDASPNPLSPTHGESLLATLTPAEQRRLEAHLRPLVERGRHVRRLAVAELWAAKPPSPTG